MNTYPLVSGWGLDEYIPDVETMFSKYRNVVHIVLISYEVDFHFY